MFGVFRNIKEKILGPEILTQYKLNKMLLAAAFQGDVNKAEAAISKGADVNYVYNINEDGVEKSVLYAATFGSAEKIVELLLENGADASKIPSDIVGVMYCSLRLEVDNELTLYHLIKHGIKINLEWFEKPHSAKYYKNLAQDFVTLKLLVLAENSENIVQKDRMLLEIFKVSNNSKIFKDSNLKYSKKFLQENNIDVDFLEESDQQKANISDELLQNTDDNDDNIDEDSVTEELLGESE